MRSGMEHTGPNRRAAKTARTTGGNTPPTPVSRSVTTGGNTPASRVVSAVVNRVTGGNTPAVRAARNTGIVPPRMRAAKTLDRLGRSKKPRKGY